MRTVAFSFSALVAFSSIAYGHPLAEESVEQRLPARWFHARGHPVHALFKRGDDGGQYEQPGSPTWASAYPEQTPNAAEMPQPWKDALKAAQDAGKIPDIPQSKSDGGNPVYPNGIDPMSPEVCSSTPKCRQPDDIWDAPEGYFGTGFDDGPYLGSNKLYDFLEEKKIGATHFMIGMYIRNNPDTFLRAYNLEGSDIAVHTYTHPYMTTLSNEDVVAQLAWTMQIIHDSTGGRVPRYWRPPYGDADNRVRAIAKEVLGLQVIMWNQDTEDWSIGQPSGTTQDQVAKSMQQWLSGAKNPGLIILEHELNDNTVQAFIDAYPQIAANGWKMESQARLADGNPDNGQAGVWQNAADSTGDVVPQSVGASPSGPSPTSGGGSESGDSSSAAGPDATPDPGNSGSNGGNDSNGDSNSNGGNDSNGGGNDNAGSEESGSSSSSSLPSLFSIVAALLVSSTFA